MISDEDLLLYQYGELDASEQRRIAAALAEDAALQARLKQLVHTLDRAAPAEAAVPAQTLQRLQARLNAAAHQSDRAKVSPNWRLRFALAGFATCVVAVSMVALRDRPGVEPADTRVAQGTIRPDSNDAKRFERSLRIHLSETEQQLAKLEQLQAQERRSLLEKTLLENRLYAIAADRVNEPRYARALRGFAPLIERIRHEGDITTADADVAQLTFELKVMQARLNAQTNRAGIIQSNLPI